MHVAAPSLREATDNILAQEAVIKKGGSKAGHERQKKLGRLNARERVAGLLDDGSPFLELGLWAAHEMYPEWGEVPAAGLVAGVGWVSGQPCLIAANDATVKAGAMFPQSIKKLLRGQRIAGNFRLPMVYLVDSSGVFLPLQDEVFPDEDDFGRIFRNNSVLSAAGIPQFAAVMGSCVAGGAYLPVLCDKVLMTEGSQLCLAGVALVKAAIGQEVDPEELSGAKMHASISGTVDFREPDDQACLRRLRELVALLPQRETLLDKPAVAPRVQSGGHKEPTGAARDPQSVYGLVPQGNIEFDIRDVLATIVDADSLQEYKAEFGLTIVTAYARIEGHPIGIVANQRKRAKTATGELQTGGVIYTDAADKAARFVMDCNQSSLPLVFLQDVQGFMVGRQSEQSGIIRSGAKLVNAVSNSVVPKFTVVIGGSFGAGNYAMCGKAYDPWLILAWPSARYAVMGARQAAETLLSLKLREAEKSGHPLSQEEIADVKNSILTRYEDQTDIRYGAARGWVDAIISPHDTRMWLSAALGMIPRGLDRAAFRTGVLQV